ncbi:protein enabled homolog [Anopheles stephensi]|uniref:protein enabled homolog n=1 Tax=Anopheles stephensi TaxID=30069 RepID=UPI0016589C20|nr:protein enabled homolog [Anopheles stephensi]
MADKDNNLQKSIQCSSSGNPSTTNCRSSSPPPIPPSSANNTLGASIAILANRLLVPTRSNPPPPSPFVTPECSFTSINRPVVKYASTKENKHGLPYRPPASGKPIIPPKPTVPSKPAIPFKSAISPKPTVPSKPAIPPKQTVPPKPPSSAESYFGLANLLDSCPSYSGLSQLDRIERKVDVGLEMMKKTAGYIKLALNRVNANGPIVPRNFTLDKVNTEEALNKLNNVLQEGYYMAELVSDMTHLLKNITDYYKRLCILMDLVFEKEFLKKCSWTGRGLHESKICMSKYSQILKFFKIVGGNEVSKLTDDQVKFFLLKNFIILSQLDN